jgi:hypothetical protein
MFSARDNDQVLFGITHCLIDRECGVSTFAKPNPHATFAVANNNDDTEVKATPACHHARYATRINRDLLKLTLFARSALTATATATSCAPTTTAFTTTTAKGVLLGYRYSCYFLGYCFDDWFLSSFHNYLKSKAVSASGIRERFDLSNVFVPPTIKDNRSNARLLRTLCYLLTHLHRLLFLRDLPLSAMRRGKRTTCLIINNLCRYKSVRFENGETWARCRAHNFSAHALVTTLAEIIL